MNEHEEPKEEHNVEAYYSLSAISGRHAPVFRCSCGWSLEGLGCVTWQEAGAEYDAHLAVVRR